MSVRTALVMETQFVTTQLDPSRVCAMQDLLVMDLIVQVSITIKEAFVMQSLDKFISNCKPSLGHRYKENIPPMKMLRRRSCCCCIS